MLVLSSWAAFAQSGQTVLKGTVIDAADGYPLIGVSVVVSGTKTGVVTDIDGNYEIKVAQDRKSVV